MQSGRALTSSVRRYSGEHLSHSHDFAQVLFALQGSMELEVAGRTLFADVATGLVIPAGIEHGYMAPREVRMLVIDAPETAGLDRVRRFAVTADCRRHVGPERVVAQLAAVLDAPEILARRRIDLATLDAALDAALHESWTTARMAALFCLSPQRFHARLLELTARTPLGYVRERRLDAAERWLQRGATLDAAALQVGYRSASALCFALRRDRRVGARSLRAG